jgi:hypothetical protein
MSELGGKIYRVWIVLTFVTMVVGYYVLDMSIYHVAKIGLVISVIAVVTLAAVVLFHEEVEGQ